MFPAADPDRVFRRPWVQGLSAHAAGFPAEGLPLPVSEACVAVVAGAAAALPARGAAGCALLPVPPAGALFAVPSAVPPDTVAVPAPVAAAETGLASCARAAPFWPSFSFFLASG